MLRSHLTRWQVGRGLALPLIQRRIFHKVSPLLNKLANDPLKNSKKPAPKTTGDEKAKNNLNVLQKIQNSLTSRVTKEQLLANATSFFSRVLVRVRWLLKRSNRPFNTDDYSAFFSWLVMGNVLLFFLATTTFFSLVITTANTVFAQEFVGRKIGEFLTKNSNLTVTFENAVVPAWLDAKISFRKCFVSRRPKNHKTFVQGSQSEAYAASLDHSNENQLDEPFDDGNYTQFDLTIEEINVTLSFKKWLNGAGIVKTMSVNGVRGVVDRTHVHWNPEESATKYKNVHQPDDFEFDNFKLNDVLFRLMQPSGFRPFNVAIYNCELSQLRKHWLFYDFLNAERMSGSYDESLFTVHKRQRLNDFNLESESSKDWKRVTRIRVDALNIDHLNKGLEGPFGWITSGTVDMTGDIMVPQEVNELTVSEIVASISNSIIKETDIFQSNKSRPIRTNKPAVDILKFFVLDLKIKLNNARALVPFQSRDLSYVNYALIRPIVGYINSHNTFIEVESRIVKNIEDFAGSWTIYDCLLMDDISEEVYENFVDYVADEEQKLLRMKKVGFWSLQLLIQFIVFGIGAVA